MAKLLLTVSTAALFAASAAQGVSLNTYNVAQQRKQGWGSNKLNKVSPPESTSAPFADYAPAWYGADNGIWLSADSVNNAVFEFTHTNQLNAYDAKTGVKFAHRSFGSYPVDDGAQWTDAGDHLLVGDFPDQLTNYYPPNQYVALHKSNLTQKWGKNFTTENGCAQFQRKNYVVISETFFAIAREHSLDGRGVCGDLNLTLAGYNINGPSGDDATPAWFWPGLPGLAGNFTVFGMDYAAADHPTLVEEKGKKNQRKDKQQEVVHKKNQLGGVAFLFKTSQGFNSNHNIHRIIVISGHTGILQSDCEGYYEQWPILNENHPTFQTSSDGTVGYLSDSSNVVAVDLVTCRTRWNWTVPQEQGYVQEVTVHEEGYVTIISYQGGSSFYNTQLWYYVLHYKSGEPQIDWTWGPKSQATWADNHPFGTLAVAGGYVFAAVDNQLQARKLGGYGNIRWAVNMSYAPKPRKSPVMPDVYIVNKNAAEEMIMVVGGDPSHKTATIAYRHYAHGAPPPPATSGSFPIQKCTSSSCSPSSCHDDTMTLGCVVPPGDGTSHGTRCSPDGSTLITTSFSDNVDCMGGTESTQTAGGCHSSPDGNYFKFKSCRTN